MDPVKVPEGRPSPYRFVVLAALFLATMAIELQWLAHAPVASAAQAFFGFDSVAPVNRLADVYMLVYLAACLPASWVIDRLGTRVGIGIGATLLAVFAVVKGVWADDYAVVLGAQAMLAVGQPFLINAPTAVASRWFPVGERGTAVGLASLAQFAGIILAMVVTPLAIQAGGTPDPSRIPRVMQAYGWASLAAAVACLLLYRAGPGETAALRERAGAALGLGNGAGAVRRVLGMRDLRRTLLLFLVGLGIFNALTTCIDGLARGKGLDAEQGGLVGGMILVGGVAGAVLLPLLSDRLRRRKVVLVGALALAVPGLAGLAWADGFGASLAFAALVGFAITGAGPIGFQYAAEVGGPATESTSQGLMLLAGQVSGIVFVELMGHDAWIPPMMIAFVVLATGAVALGATLRESPAAGPRPPAPA